MPAVDELPALHVSLHGWPKTGRGWNEDELVYDVLCVETQAFGLAFVDEGLA